MMMSSHHRRTNHHSSMGALSSSTSMKGDEEGDSRRSHVRGSGGGSTNTSLSGDEEEGSGPEEEEIASAASVGDVSAGSSRHISSRFGPRLAPIGAEQDSTGGSVADSLPGAGTTTSSLSGGGLDSSVEVKLSRLKLLEEQQEDLNSSLLNLTSHFAQVQFRLKQIINAPPHVKQDLLAELEEFAGKGCVDTRHVKKSKESLVSVTGAGAKSSQEDMSAEEHEAKIAEQKQKQQELISELKEQLMELETFAYESGQGELPQSVLVEKQKAMIDQLRSRLNINLDDFDHLSTEELKKIVDSSLQRIINPAKAKEDLLYQLQSQISDLERFIDFLMAEGSVAPVGNQALCSCNRKCPVHNEHDHHHHSHDCDSSRSTSAADSTTTSKRKFLKGGGSDEEKKQQRQKQETYNTVKKTMYLIQMYLLANMSCVGGGVGAAGGSKAQGSGRRHNNSSESEMRSEKDEFDHQFKLKLNKLSKTVDTVIQLNSETCMDTDYFSDSSDTPSVLVNAELLKTVRRNLVYSLKELLQFAVIPSGSTGKESSSVISPFNCFSGRSARLKRNSAAMAAAHIWQLFLAYYEIKHGNDYVHTPARKLTDAFRLDSFGGSGTGLSASSTNVSSGGGSTPGGGSRNSRSQAITAKQTLLTAIYDIVSTHEPLKRTYDSQFKAFVCRGLNEKRLGLWFRLVLRTQEIVERYYSSWNFMTKAYFDDITKLLEKLSNYNFSLPVNMAVQPIRNIKDAF